MILVVGATGSLGGRIARTLLTNGRQVRALVRQNSPSAALAEQGRANAVWSLADGGAVPVYGDLRDDTSLHAAVRGVETVIATATAFQRAGSDTVEAVDLDGTLRLIAAARDMGVRRFIYMSVQGASAHHPLRLWRAKATCQRALEASGMTYTILQPSNLMETWLNMVVGIPLSLGRPVNLVGRADRRHNFVSEEDVARQAAALVDDPRAFNRRMTLNGPAVHSWSDIVRVVRERTGAPVPVQYQLPGLPVSYLPEEASEVMNAQETSLDLPDDCLPAGDPAAPTAGRFADLEQVIDRTFARPARLKSYRTSFAF